MASFQTPRTYNLATTGPIVSSSSGWNLQFGFLPRVIRIENLGTNSFWVKFGASTTATTQDILITSCSASGLNFMQLALDRECAVAALSLGATSTAGTAANVWAIG